jgi:hypothetical protein
MKITATDKTIHEIAKIEVERMNRLIELNAIDVNEIDLNHIDVSEVTNMNELFMNMEFKKPLNINSWDFYSVKYFPVLEAFTGNIKSWDVK